MEYEVELGMELEYEVTVKCLCCQGQVPTRLRSLKKASARHEPDTYRLEADVELCPRCAAEATA